jgi:N,N'-diacetyllegionaminate synthase
MIFPAIIAEIGSVHDGSFGNACKLIEAAAKCGADVVKFQTHIAEAETLRGAATPAYFTGEPRYEYFQRTAFSESEWLKLKAVCSHFGVQFLSSPFSIEAVDLLERVGVDAYKVPSGETSNTPLLERLAATGKGVLLSTGMSDWHEIDRAVSILKVGGPLVIMQCTSEYPCPPEKVGLNVITEMRERYGITVGFSDHTLGTSAAFAAAAMGADVVEKHFTFSRLMYGSDAANSMEPDEFLSFTSGIREIWKMRCNPVDKDDVGPYREMKQIFEKSIVMRSSFPVGHVLAESDFAFKKPGDGIPAARWPELVGRTLLRSVEANYKLSEEDCQ